MRCIRKYGSFDNYVLLTKPKNMDSIYGEYLRNLMYTKLNNDDFKVPYLVKQATACRVPKKKLVHR